MRKMLSVLLAVVMLFAACVPAFAGYVPIDQNTPNGTGDSIVKTKTTTAGGESAERFTVSFPSETTIPWLTEAFDIAYTVEAHLAYGKRLIVTVADKDAQNKMTYTPAAGVTLELPYTLSNTTYVAGPVVNLPADSATNAAATISIAENDWNNAVIGEYSDTLTFTVATETVSS